jgi:hypothetical protein
VHHFLNSNANENFLVSEPFLVSVENGARSEKTGPALHNFINKIISAFHVQERFLLPSERSVWKIFRRSA